MQAGAKPVTFTSYPTAAALAADWKPLLAQLKIKPNEGPGCGGDAERVRLELRGHAQEDAGPRRVWPLRGVTARRLHRLVEPVRVLIRDASIKKAYSTWANKAQFYNDYRGRTGRGWLGRHRRSPVR